jgi:hypothetical protein
MKEYMPMYFGIGQFRIYEIAGHQRSSDSFHCDCGANMFRISYDKFICNGCKKERDLIELK